MGQDLKYRLVSGLINRMETRNEDDKAYDSFPSYTLNSKSTVTVYTGEGTSTATELYWQLGSPVWNNGGDIASQYGNSGKVVYTLER